jgi:hypothetical protein
MSESKLSPKLRLRWRIGLVLLGFVGGLACCASYEIDRSIRNYYFRDFRPWSPHLPNVLLALAIIYFLVVGFSGRWWIIARRAPQASNDHKA